MKVWQATEWCEPEALRLNDVPPPEPGPSQVRIRNRAAALNFFDLLQIQGKYQHNAPLPFTPGAEVAGIVDAIGAEIRNVRVGDRVLAFSQAGGYSELSLANGSRTFPMPDGMGWAEAAALPIVYHTSWFALQRRAALKAGEWLLVHAGASGVGMSAIQIGKALGAQVIATAGAQEKLDFALEQGAAHAVNYSTPDWVDRVKEITEMRGAEVVYEPVGGDVFNLSSKCTAREGRILVIGFANGRIPVIQTNRLLLKNVSVVGVFWGDFANSRPGYVAETQAALERMYAAGKIRPVVGKRYAFDEAPSALRDLAARKVIGKAVLEING